MWVKFVYRNDDNYVVEASTLKKAYVKLYRYYLENDLNTYSWFSKEEIDSKVLLFKGYVEQIEYENNLKRFYNLLVKDEDYQIKYYEVV